MSLLFVLAIAFLCFLLWRNQQVSNFFGELIDVAKENIRAPVYDQLIDEISVTKNYSRMVFTFWKPLPSFFAETEILRLWSRKKKQ